VRYFVDHKTKLIHKILSAGDECGFNTTPVSEREFTNNTEYIEKLTNSSEYERCPHCQKFALVSD
jgi:hypothetical protein